MEVDLLMMIAGGAFIALIVLSIMFFRKPKNIKEEERRPLQQPLANRMREGVPRRAQMARNRGARLRANAVAPDDEPNDSDDENEAATNLDLSDKLGAKKRAKLEAKAEKKASREAEDNIRADKKKREALAEEERKKADDKAKLDEKLREETELKAKLDKERKEHEEYLKMKEAFSVEEEGFEEGEAGDESNLLQTFITYIQNQKVVVIEDLAAKFKLKTQNAIDRIKDLQADNILTGVIDDRGKFIYVSQNEMEQVAKFIKQRGRVSIAELAENSNQLINLTPVITN